MRTSFRFLWFKHSGGMKISSSQGRRELYSMQSEPVGASSRWGPQRVSGRERQLHVKHPVSQRLKRLQQRVHVGAAVTKGTLHRRHLLLAASLKPDLARRLAGTAASPKAPCPHLPS